MGLGQRKGIDTLKLKVKQTLSSSTILSGASFSWVIILSRIPWEKFLTPGKGSAGCVEGTGDSQLLDPLF